MLARPDSGIYPVWEPSVALQSFADVADHVTTDVPPRATVRGLAESWMSGAAWAAGIMANIGETRTSEASKRIGDLQISRHVSPVESPSLKKVSIETRLSVRYSRQIKVFFYTADRCGVAVSDTRQEH